MPGSHFVPIVSYVIGAKIVGLAHIINDRKFIFTCIILMFFLFCITMILDLVNTPPGITPITSIFESFHLSAD